MNNNSKLRKFDRVELVSASGHFDVELRVDQISGGLPVFRIIRANIVEAGTIAGFHVDHHPESNTWSAHANGEMIAEGFADRATAEAVLAEHRGVA